MMLREAEDIGRREGEERGRAEAAIGMAEKGISLETIAEILKYTVDTIKMWINNPMARV